MGPELDYHLAVDSSPTEFQKMSDIKRFWGKAFLTHAMVLELPGTFQVFRCVQVFGSSAPVSDTNHCKTESRRKVLHPSVPLPHDAVEAGAAKYTSRMLRGGTSIGWRVQLATLSQHSGGEVTQKTLIETVAKQPGARESPPKVRFHDGRHRLSECSAIGSTCLTSRRLLLWRRHPLSWQDKVVMPLSLALRGCFGRNGGHLYDEHPPRA